MTRKDYQTIAGALADSLSLVDGDEHLTEWLAIAGTIAMVASALAADNPRFDRVKFIEACGL